MNGKRCSGLRAGALLVATEVLAGALTHPTDPFLGIDRLVGRIGLGAKGTYENERPLGLEADFHLPFVFGDRCFGRRDCSARLRTERNVGSADGFGTGTSE